MAPKSPEERQKEFEQLSQEEQQRLVEEAHEEANKMQEKNSSGKAENYEGVEEQIEREKNEYSEIPDLTNVTELMPYAIALRNIYDFEEPERKGKHRRYIEKWERHFSGEKRVAGDGVVDRLDAYLNYLSSDFMQNLAIEQGLATGEVPELPQGGSLLEIGGPSHGNTRDDVETVSPQRFVVLDPHPEILGNIDTTQYQLDDVKKLKPDLDLQSIRGQVENLSKEVSGKFDYVTAYNVFGRENFGILNHPMFGPDLSSTEKRKAILEQIAEKMKINGLFIIQVMTDPGDNPYDYWALSEEETKKINQGLPESRRLVPPNFTQRPGFTKAELEEIGFKIITPITKSGMFAFQYQPEKK